MKKVLIIACDFPPYVSVGALRPYAWYKYLKEYGIEPIVATRQWNTTYKNELDYVAPSESKETIIETTECGTIIRAPYVPSISNNLLLEYGNEKFSVLRKAFSAFDELRQYVCISTPKKHIFYAAQEYLQSHKVDAIIATGEPFVLFYYAAKLSKQFSVPWIADYRDPWSQNKDRSKTLFHAWYNAAIEKSLLSSAVAITTVSSFFKKKITQNTGSTPCHILPNGYNPESMAAAMQVSQSRSKLVVSFVGTIYNWHPWQSFLSVLSQVIVSTQAAIEFRMYGINNEAEVLTFIQSLPESVQGHIHIYPRMPNADLLVKLAESNMFLLFNYYSIIGTKIYDYLALKRKILLCYTEDLHALELKRQYYSIDELEDESDNLQARVIEKTNSGVAVKNEQELHKILLQSIEEYNAHGYIACNSHNTEQYSRKIQVQKLAKIITEISAT